jgi:hypothetical protein
MDTINEDAHTTLNVKRAGDLSGIASSTRGNPFLIAHEFPVPELGARWREFLSQTECPAHYNAPDFFLEPYWKNQKPFAVLAFEREKIIGVLTGVHVDGSVVCGQISRPQVSIAGGEVGRVATDILARGLLDEAGSAKLISVFGWNWTPLHGFERLGFRKRELEGNVVLDLGLGKDALFKGFHENRKRNIRTAIKNGIEVSEVVTADDLAAYWAINSAWRQTKRKKIKDNPTFAEIELTHKLRQNRRRFLARYQGKAIAASGVRFYPGGLIEYAGNCSLDEFIHLRPNDLLLWKTVEWACEQGFAKYSLGGAHPFLRKSGGAVVPIHRYRLDRSFLRRHDLRENITTVAREFGHRLPQPVQDAVRRVLRRR